MSYKALTVSSGGFKAILELGALHECYTKNMLNDIEYLSGASAGSIICALFACGITPIEMLTAICSPEFERQFEHINITKIPTDYGVFSTMTIRNTLDRMIKSKLGTVPTFKELYEKCNKYLLIPSYCITTKSNVYFSHETHPDMLISEAVALSCTIPFIFQASKYNDELYIDGAFVSMFPFDELKARIPDDCRILGIRLKNNNNKIENFIDYAISIVSISLKDEYTKGRYDDVIDIENTKNTSFFSTTMTLSEKIQLFMSGSKQTEEYFKNSTIDQRQ